jgi:outer membrane protein TolC
MLSLGYARKRTPMERMPMYDLMLEQPLPRWGERDAARAMAASATRLSDAEIASDVAMLAGDLALAVAEIDGLQERLAEGEQEDRRITALSAAIDARVASGEAGVLERLGIDTRRERLHLRLDDVRRSLADRAADIRGRLAVTPDAPLPPFAAPQPDAIDPAHTPAALDAEAKHLEALASLQEARAMGHPETAIGVRAERESADAGNEDTVGLTLTISLPIARGAIAAGEDAAHARLRAAERMAEAARWRTTSAVERARRALVQAERAAQLANGLLTRAAAEQQTLVAALGSGGANLTALLDLHDRLAELRLEVIDARVAARQAQADLWVHVIPDLPPVSGNTP